MDFTIFLILYLLLLTTLSYIVGVFLKFFLFEESKSKKEFYKSLIPFILWVKYIKNIWKEME
jgi:hypothetical protein